ncbi:MAG TPA: peptidase M10 [Myxococcales bacterium]|nr:peptidase M10 [Myxococcales bacterium]
MNKLSRSILVAMFSLALVACGGEALVVQDEVEELDTVRQGMTWDEFLTHIYQEPETGVYIVDGDTPIANEKKLREFYELHVKQGQLIIHQNGGLDAKWNDSQKKNLTYCVSYGFGNRYDQVVQAMAAATGAWEAVADVKFVHRADQDSGCTSSNSNVVFDVNPVNVSGQYLARAFFPDQTRSTRNVLIDSTAFGSSNPSLTGILRHELGHTLGFRHEHTRPESGTCFEDRDWRPLTTYDSESVMHYPQCNGTGDWSLTLTERDASGAASLYGAPSPDAPAEPPSGGGETGDTGESERVVEQLSGSVAKRESKSFGPFEVEPGTLFDVAMTGSGDPDLYVRFGSEPSTSTYDCRPYLAGANETCSLSVPVGKTTAYVMVRGYSAASFELQVVYTRTAPVDDAPTPLSATFGGTLNRNQSARHGPLPVVPGSTFTVTMSGSGDPDLYVRFGAQPTRSAFDCRPYLDGAAETCSVRVPAGQGNAYLMVHGYRASTYSLAVRYLAP